MIRPASVKDLQAVVDIAKDCKPWLVGISAKWLVGELAKPGENLAVWVDAAGVVKGFVLVSGDPDGYSVELVGIAKDSRRKGIGRSLMEMATQNCGGLPMRTVVHPDNKASLGMMKRLASWGWKRGKTDGTYVHFSRPAVL